MFFTWQSIIFVTTRLKFCQTLGKANHFTYLDLSKAATKQLKWTHYLTSTTHRNTN